MKKSEIFTAILLHLDLMEMTNISPLGNRIEITLDYNQDNLVLVHRIFQLELSVDLVQSNLLPPDETDNYELCLFGMVPGNDPESIEGDHIGTEVMFNLIIKDES